MGAEARGCVRGSPRATATTLCVPSQLEKKNGAGKHVAAASECQLGEWAEVALGEWGILLFKISQRSGIKSDPKPARGGLGSNGNISQMSGKIAFLGSARTRQQLEQDFAKHSQNFRFIEPDIIKCIGQDT